MAANSELASLPDAADGVSWCRFGVGFWTALDRFKWLAET